MKKVKKVRKKRTRTMPVDEINCKASGRAVVLDLVIKTFDICHGIECPTEYWEDVLAGIRAGLNDLENYLSEEKCDHETEH